MRSSHVRLDLVDAVELAELLEFVAGWVGCPHGSESFAAFSGLGFAAGEFQEDLARFVFLLGGTAAGLVGPGGQQ